jgi:hypothetical protein
MFASVAIVALAVVTAGCSLRQWTSTQREALPPTLPLSRVAVVGFLVGVSAGGEEGLFRDPFSGASVFAHSVSEDIAAELTQVLFGKLTDEKNLDLVPLGETREALLCSVLAPDSGFELKPIGCLRELGKTLGADGVLAGHVYRWRERIGGDFAVDRPASVSFDLNLVRTEDGTILWRGQFDKTQTSLSENLLDMGTFLGSGGRWLTAEKLADFGLDRIIKEMPRFSGHGEK